MDDSDIGDMIVLMRDFEPQPPCIPLPTQVAAVTVYPDQARITRQGQLEVAPASMVLEIGPLPAALQTNGVQAHVYGSARVTLQKPLVELVNPVPEQSGNEPILQAAVTEAEDRFRQCKDELASLQLQKTFLENLTERSSRSFAQGLSQQSTHLENVAGFLAFVESSHTRVSRAIASQERLKHTLDLELQALRQKALQHQNKALPTQYQILLPVEVHSPGTLQVDIVYNVDKAKWNPVYEVRVEKDLNALQINYIAEIQQQTGEPWKQVELKVSTAAPEKTPAIPNAPLWHVLTPATNEKGSGAGSNPQIRSRSKVLDDAYRMLGAIPGSEIPPNNAEEETVSASYMKLVGTTIGFSTQGLTRIPADGQPHPVTLARLEFKSQFAYVAIPQQCSAPYLQARFSNPPEGMPLLPGKVWLFRSGGYIGEENLEYVAPGGSFEISLGLDERIAVQRELVVKEAVTEAGSVDISRDRRAYRLTIHNPFSYAIAMEVLEQIPTSRSEEIQISLVKAEPASSINQTGICQWSLQLQPQETYHIFYEYVVEHPSSISIRGLDA